MKVAIAVISVALFIMAGAVVVGFDLVRENGRSYATLEMEHAKLTKDFDELWELLALSEANLEALREEVAAVKINFSSTASRLNARPTESEKNLMASLNALRSGLQIGVSFENYNKLVREASASLASLLSNEEASDFSRAVNSYLVNHARIASVWNQILIGDGRAYIGESSLPELHAWLRKMIDSKVLSSEAWSGLRDDGAAIVVFRSKIGELWSVSEREWPAIERIWGKLKN
jgi:SAM-dependent methyltransferase